MHSAHAADFLVHSSLGPRVHLFKTGAGRRLDRPASPNLGDRVQARDTLTVAWQRRLQSPRLDENASHALRDLGIRPRLATIPINWP